MPTWISTAKSPCTAGSHSSVSLDPADRALARRVDALVSDAIEDAGLELELRSSQTETMTPRCHGEVELLSLGQQEVVVFAELIRNDDHFVLKLIASGPRSKVLHVAAQELSPQELDVRTVVMVSELLREVRQPNATSAAPPGSSSAAPGTDPSSHRGTASKRSHSPGRGILTLTSGVLGGAVGYSLQRASGSDDPRLTYPLIALGAGLGLGASMIASDEWDISVAEAWFMNAGLLWPTSSGLLLARAYEVSPKTDRYAYGLAGAGIGLALSSFALTTTEISEGDAALTHSGGAMGLLLGGLVDMTFRGATDYIPWHGMGYGSAVGFLLAGAAATQVEITSSQVIFTDMGAGLGALTGAAIGSPLLFVENDIPSSKRQRAWLGILAGGALSGGILGWYYAKNSANEEREGSRELRYWPYVGLVPDLGGSPNTPCGNVGAGIEGVF